jgi:large subunit ribosomal protein L10e
MAYTSKKYAPGAPNPKIARFTTGKSRLDYDFKLQVVSDGRVQIRSNALEAARVAASKKLATLTEEQFYLKVVTYPFVILRENKMIATAGADRLQEGMRKAFGKPIGMAARVGIGSVVMELSVTRENLDKAKMAMWAAATKLPMKAHTEIIELRKPEVATASQTPA